MNSGLDTSSIAARAGTMGLTTCVLKLITEQLFFLDVDGVPVFWIASFSGLSSSFRPCSVTCKTLVL